VLNTTLTIHLEEMDPTSRNFKPSITSGCSSAYCFDGWVSDIDSASNQPLNRACHEADINSMTQSDAEHLHHPHRPSHHLDQPSQTCMVDEPAPTGDLDVSSAQYRSETPEEAEDRCCLVAIQAHADGRDSPTPLEAESVGPRPPTPPRRRPRIASVDDYVSASRRNTTVSMASQSLLLTMDSRDLVNKYTDDIGPRRCTVRKTVRSIDPISESAEPGVTRNASVIEPKDGDEETSRQQEQRANALQALSGHVKVPSSPTDLGCGASGMPREGSSAGRRQGKVDWREDLTGKAIDRTSSTLVSVTGNEYGLGNHEAGYCSSVFVTNLQQTTPRSDEQRKLRLKRIFCL
jgi:hypothetical protein